MASFERIVSAQRVKAMFVASDRRVWVSNVDYSPISTHYWDDKAWFNTNYAVEFAKILERNGTIWGIPNSAPCLSYNNGVSWISTGNWPHGTSKYIQVPSTKVVIFSVVEEMD